jgi:hypothetical protein
MENYSQFIKSAGEFQTALQAVVKAADTFRSDFQVCATGPAVEPGIADKFKTCALAQMAIFDQLDEMVT